VTVRGAVQLGTARISEQKLRVEYQRQRTAALAHYGAIIVSQTEIKLQRGGKADEERQTSTLVQAFLI
jgi:hypothetical protein